MWKGMLFFLGCVLEQMPRPRASSQESTINSNQNSVACDGTDGIRNGLTPTTVETPSATGQQALFTSSTKAIVWGNTNLTFRTGSNRQKF